MPMDYLEHFYPLGGPQLLAGSSNALALELVLNNTPLEVCIKRTDPDID